MPSWDEEFSDPELLSDLVDSDYAPDVCEDLDFNGLAVDFPHLCRVHKLVTKKCVAFGGSDTGRRFFMCSVENAVNNCGFVCWLDAEWPAALKNSLGRLWSMYEESNNGRIEEKIQNGKMLQELATEKKKVDKDYTTLLADVKKYIGDLEKRTMDVNYQKIMEKSEEGVVELKKEVAVLKSEVEMLKNVQKTQADVMKARQNAWDEEKDALKEEKKKLEYMIYDLLKVGEANKEKLKRMKAICDE